MNCTEVEIWIMESSEVELASPGKDLESHLQSCVQCNQKRIHVMQAYNFMSKQADSGLSDEKTQALLENIKLANRKKTTFNNSEWLMRIAAVLVVAFGLLAGILVGNNYMFTEDEDAYWNEEFAVLTDTSEETLFE